MRIENVRVRLLDKIHKDGNGVFHRYLFRASLYNLNDFICCLLFHSLRKIIISARLARKAA